MGLWSDTSPTEHKGEKPMAQITGGELLLKCLAQEKIKYIFAVPDAGYNPLLGKLKEYRVRLIPPRHEAAAAHMADAMARTS